MASEAEGRKRKERMGWTDASEAALLEMWPFKLCGLRGHRKNGHIYAEMAEELIQQGHTCTPRDVQVKIQNFTQRYRKEKAAVGVSGGSPSTWCHYQRVHEVIGGFKSNAFLELTLESIDDVADVAIDAAPSASGTPSDSPSSPCTSESARKKMKFSFKEVVLEELNTISSQVEKHLNKSEENDRELIALEREKLELERKKLEVLDSIAEQNKNVNLALIEYLNKK